MELKYLSAKETGFEPRWGLFFLITSPVNPSEAVADKDRIDLLYECLNFAKKQMSTTERNLEFLQEMVDKLSPENRKKLLEAKAKH